MDMNLKTKLLHIQQELKVPKGRPNRFGGYKYRSAEDILTAVKPLLQEYGVLLVLTDTIEQVGDRYYVKATATLTDTDLSSGLSTTAYARETAERKKYDDSQLTGAASSYARKYALGGLFLIDDTADADTYEEPADDDPAELDRQEAEERAAAEEPVERKPRARRRREADPDPEPEQDVADHDRFYYIEANGNVVKVPAGVPYPGGGEEITELQFRAASIEIAKKGRQADVQAALKMADAMNIPEDAPEEVPYDEDPEPAEEEKPRTRRTRRKRA